MFVVLSFYADVEPCAHTGVWETAESVHDSADEAYDAEDRLADLRRGDTLLVGHEVREVGDATVGESVWIPRQD